MFKTTSNSCDRWTPDLSSIIELELAEAFDVGIERKTLNQRDKEVIRHIHAAGLGDKDRSQILQQWLESRRADPEFSRFQVHDRLQVISRRMAGLGAIISGMLGATFAWGALNLRAGGESVDVIIFWCLTTLLPAALTLLATILLLRDAVSTNAEGPSGIRELLAKFLRWRWRKTSSGVSERWIRAVGELEMRLATREGILGAMLSQLIYRMGFAGVLGIWLAVVSFETFKDQQYSWKSQATWMTEERVGKAASAIAGPWSWFDPSAKPTREQVEESRVTPDSPRPSQRLEARMAWISFVNMSVLVYALIPRLVLLGLGRIRMRRLLAREDFGPERFSKLCRRLLHPGSGFTFDEDAPKQQPPPGCAAPPEKQLPRKVNLLLIPKGVSSKEINLAIAQAAKEEGFAIDRTESFSPLPKEQEELFTRLAAAMRQEVEAIFILQDFSLPFMASFERLHQRLRHHFCSETPIRVILVSTENDAQERNRSSWEPGIGRLRDPFLSMTILNGNS